ncbi:hypothetical protein G6F37_012404 [Rhizopus arrhizus]|nr:hypothetical protein G6F38_012326 [Rhizopus arrhizus]KAG1143856.1 hypothetical protein G6F37_012404 [Rhizopus arrhizus]
MLRSYNITQWHDKSCPTAAIYLGFPLTQSSTQLKDFLANLIVRVQKQADYLSQRNLSVLGRSTVVNSLILSRIWHAIRVIAPPRDFLSKIRSIVIQFLSKRSFPAVSFAVCQRPRKEGGLAVLDPANQHAALQLRWLQPLLTNSYSSDDDVSFATDLLCYCLRTLSQSPSHLLPFIFPELRTAAVKSFGCFKLLFKTFDHMDYQVDWSSFNSTMVEQLPLIRVCPDLDTRSDSPRSTNWSNVLVKDAYIFDHANGTLRRKPLLPRSRHRNKLLKYFELLNSGIIKETDFFKQFKRPPARPPDDSQLIYFRRPDPHFDQILQPFLHDGTALVSLSTKWFRTLQLDPLETLPDHYPTASQVSWRTFWTCAIPHKARSILWRLYHRKLSCRSRLHRLIPSRIPNPCCPLCGDDETDEHFLWSCPDKRPIWSTLASRFLVDPNCLQFSHVSQLPPIELAILPNFHFDGFIFIACTVIAIWQIHWKYVFHSPEFWPDEAAARATLLLRRLDRENAYQQQMKEKRKEE